MVLNFEIVSMGIKELVDSYTFKYGEGSCQHSFASSFTLKDKYGDMFCEYNDFLYTLRSRKNTGTERVYLFPHGDISNLQSLRDAIVNIFNDAHEHNATVKFETLTEKAKNLIITLFPNKFTVEGNRNFSEYIYEVEKLINYPGPELAYKRRDFQRFCRDYKGRVIPVEITCNNVGEVKQFQREWLRIKLSKVYDNEHYEQIINEDKGIQIALDNFSQLGLTGIMIKIDGEIKGYAYGVKLSEDYIDEINENCFHNVPNIYPFIKHEFARLCCKGYKYLNFEEDVGALELRAAKNHYKPAFLINKFILREVI